MSFNTKIMTYFWPAYPELSFGMSIVNIKHRFTFFTKMKVFSYSLNKRKMRVSMSKSSPLYISVPQRNPGVFFMFFVGRAF